MTVTDNFAFCAEAGAKGIDLKAEFARMKDELDSLHKQLDEHSERERALEEGEFRLIEKKFSSDPAVKAAKAALDAERERIMHRAALKDKIYADLYEKYRTAVREASGKVQ